MKTYKFTQVEKRYYDIEIQAETPAEAREIFFNISDEAIDWENPDYLDSDFYYEEVTEEEA